MVTGVTEITAEAEAVGSATLVAFTVTLVATLVVGAVNRPLVATVPAVALQVNWALVVVVPPVAEAVSCWLAPEETVAVAGVTVTTTVD